MSVPEGGTTDALPDSGPSHDNDSLARPKQIHQLIQRVELRQHLSRTPSHGVRRRRREAVLL